MTFAGELVLAIGAAVLLVALVGVLRLPDALAKQHAATKGATLGLWLMAIGAACAEPHEPWLLRLALLVVVLVLTLPVASHALARAAARGKA
jgi:multicomponent Na+:H+ antiporter subunit G